MKTSTKFPALVALACLAIFSGCKKLNNGTKSTTGTTTTSPSQYTNPNTTAAVCDYNFSDTSLTNHGWTKSFDDEFDSGLSNWSALTGGVPKELECNEPANVQVSNGTLQITAKQQTVTGPKTVNNDTTQSFNWTSGWIVSKNTVSANSSTPKVRIVIRMKVASGYGLTSLFYGFGGGSWPTNGEVDYVDVQGDNTKEYATDYAYGPAANVNAVSGGIEYNPVTEDLSSCYHVYTMEWTQNALTSYLDGKLVETKTKGGYIASLFGKNHYLALSLPIAGEYYPNLVAANVQGGTITVDYVKVFTSN